MVDVNLVHPRLAIKTLKNTHNATIRAPKRGYVLVLLLMSTISANFDENHF